MVIKTKFESCKEEKMNKIMKEYEYGKLKNRSNQKIIKFSITNICY